MLFEVTRKRFEFQASAEINSFRGALGAALHARGADVYERWFDPGWKDGPSGYRDAPRPFVLRRTGVGLDLILFRTEEPPDEIIECLAAAISGVTGEQRVCAMAMEHWRLRTNGTDCEGLLRVSFATPTELKSGGEVLASPDFHVLIERLTERIWTLGRLYQKWSEELPFADLLATSHEIKTVEWDWQHSEIMRRSARSAKVHPVGGFTGWASYAGPVGRFLPLLEIARWTGVGRQTVWGNGEVRIENFVPKVTSC